MQLTKQRLLAIGFIFIALVILTMQNNLSFLFLFPILLATLFISWYLYKEIQRENEENLKRGIRYMQEEAEAQQWLHKSFSPKARALAKKELRAIIIASGVVLLSFIFLGVSLSAAYTLHFLIHCLEWLSLLDLFSTRYTHQKNLPKSLNMFRIVIVIIVKITGYMLTCFYSLLQLSSYSFIQ